jgi:hypothetical protein
MKRHGAVVPYRRSLVSLIILAATLSAGQNSVAAQQPRTIVAPERFTRGAGAPATIVRTFTVAPPVAGPFTLSIDVGEPDPRRPGTLTNAGRGTVLLNGAAILGPGDFANRSHIERSVNLSSNNVLEIKLVGAAGSHFTLGITGIVQIAIAAISPDNGPVDTPVLITGSGFEPIAANNQVSFNGAAAAVLSTTATTIQTVVPPNATTGPVTVITPNGSASSTPFTVTSGNRLLISKSPDQQIYSRGQPISISALVVDRMGQPIPTPVTLASHPAEDGRVANTFVYQSDGTFTVTATATPDGETLTAAVTMTVEGQGPAIACTQPFNGAMVNGVPGSLLLQGTVNSGNGISEVTVNGAAVTVSGDSFSATINTVWGLNVVTLAVVDGAGMPARTTCSFVLADSWVPEDQHAGDAISLKLVQSAVDDNNRANAVNSFADILHAVINSASIGSTLDNALRAANPLKPQHCDQQTCVFGVCACWYSSQVTYLSSALTGPNTTSVSLVPNGMSTSTPFANVVIRLRVNGTVGGVPYDVTGDVIFEYVYVQSTFDTGLSAGRPRVTVRSGSVVTGVSSFVTDFPGLDAWIQNNIVVPLAQGQLRDTVRNVLRDYTVNNFNAVLDGMISGLDVHTLPIMYQVQRLSGGSALGVSFDRNFSFLSASTSRVLFGIGTRFESPAAHARPSLGTPLQPPKLLDPSVSGPNYVAIAFHHGIRGQALHALWRGGYFDAVLTGGALDGAVPDGAAVTTTAIVPPVTMIRGDGRTEFAIGAMSIQLQHDGMFPVPITGNLAGRVSCASRLEGDSLLLEECAIDDMQFAPAQPLDAATTTQAESIVAAVLGAMIQTAANSALPAMPIPGFTLPASLGVFGLPTGGVFGIVTPFVNSAAPHHVLRGWSGIR